MKDPVPALIVGLGAGIGVGVVLFIITFFLTFTICADTSIAERMFPYSLIVVPSIFAHPLVALVLALVQFPLYGSVLAFAWARGGETRILFVAMIFVVVVLHLTAGGFASRRVAQMWQHKFAVAGY
jgi:hypothetical protein